MSIKSLVGTTALIVALFAQNSLAVLPPLSQEAREEMASDIATGYVTSIKKVIKDVNYGTNALYTVKMIVTGVQKGKAITNGHTITFHYWKSDTRHPGWCGDGGQYNTIEHYKIIKAYLSLDESTGQFQLLHPNGFDVEE